MKHTVKQLSRAADAWNMDGSGTDKLYGQSWIIFWEEQTGLRRNKCSYKGCKRRGVHGGHVWLKGHGVCITPICSGCNNPHNIARWQQYGGGNSSVIAGTTVVRVSMTRNMKTAQRMIAVRCCESCEQDISDRPTNHTLCLDCWRDSIRCCESCEQNISDRPRNHTLCLDCWRDTRV